ncbi:MAG: hypothetical protein R6U59_08555 [Eubacteriales bacterium]
MTSNKRYTKEYKEKRFKFFGSSKGSSNTTLLCCLASISRSVSCG